LRPILMTTLALVAGMLPLALGSGPGAEERRSIAIVVIGGQSLSLLLTLLVTPVAYSLFEDVAGAMRLPALTRMRARLGRRVLRSPQPLTMDGPSPASSDDEKPIEPASPAPGMAEISARRSEAGD